MRTIVRQAGRALLALVLTSGLAAAQSKVTIAVGGGACLCYLPTVLARQLGEYEKAGLAVELVDLKGGSDALKAVLGGSADVVSGYFDHCVNLAAKKQEMQSFVVYDRYPGLVLVVSPSHNAEIKSIKDLAGKKVGVSAPGSSTDFFLKYLLEEERPRSGERRGDRRRPRRHRGGGDAAGPDRCGRDAGSVGHACCRAAIRTCASSATPAPRRIRSTCSAANIRAARSTRTTAWIKSHEKEAQALTNAIVNTLAWIHSHSPEEIMAKMPPEMVGKNKELYLAALKNTIPMYSQTGMMDPKGADAVLAVFSEGSPEVAKANIDLCKTYTNKFVEQARKTTGMNAK